MIAKIYRSILILLVMFSIQAFSQFNLQMAFPNLSFSSAVDLQNAGDLSDRIFVVEQAGIIKVFQNQASINTTKTFINLTDRVTYGGEMGLLGLAFHPDYENNGYFYVNYIIDPPLRTRISRFSVSATNPDSADKNSELVIMEFSQPFGNHNGGQIAFGPDGYLYIATGDGGSGGDPLNNAQNITNLLGKILRIDVDDPSGGLNYGIPLDNPFYDSTGTVKKEIYAYGLRNPWRFSFDPVTEWLWCGDVGQDDWEEVDLIESGKNYGWRCYEGNHPYNTSGCNGIYEPPVWEYSHSFGLAITGGYVYRGPNVPELYGKYIYGDYVTSFIWSLEYDGINPPVNNLITNAPGSITSFGVDQNQELYVVSFNGKIYKITPTAQIIAPSFLRVENPDAGEVNLNWNDNSNNETGFYIERKSGQSGSFILIDSVTSNVTNYTDFVADTNLYFYRVRAFNLNYQSGYSNEASIRVLIIPVELTNFSAKQVESSILLEWNTATELNNSGFEVEKLINNSFDRIGFVRGNGTSAKPNNYNFTDNDIIAGNNNYRLKQIDFDGSYTYSNEITINISSPDNFMLDQNYPNPFNPVTKIKFHIPERSNVVIKIINILGAELFDILNDVKDAGVYEIEFNASELPSGTYFYQLITNKQIITKKMILLK